MRRSLGGAGRGMGGGGKMITFQRAVVGGGGGAPPNTTSNIGGAKAGKANNFNKKQPSISPNTALTLYSSSSPAPFPSLLSFPIAASSAPAWTSSSTVCSDESEWEYIDGIDDDYVFGTVPSKDEVHHVVSALQQAKLGKVRNKDVDEKMINSLSDSGMDWLEPSQNLYTSKMLQHQRPRSDMVYDAFHLLETEPSVQRMVVSLSSDKAVWDAVLNNDVVKELRGSIDQVVGEGSGSGSGEKGDEGEGDIVSWMVAFAKTKMMQLLDLITTVVNKVFDDKKEEGDNNNNGNAWDGKVKSSFFLSVVVFLVIIFARTKINNASS